MGISSHKLNSVLPFCSTVLKGVPTNAQLTITLLRKGEASKAPLPPSPTSDKAPSSRPISLNGDDLALDASNDEIHEAIHQDTPPADPSGSPETEKPKHRHGERILNLFKGTAKTGVETKLGIDKVKAKIGSTNAKNHLGILPKPNEQVLSGPVDFKGRYEGGKGWVVISASNGDPILSFSRTAAANADGDPESLEPRHPIFTVKIQDIIELKKIGGLGWKAKIAVGWATNRNVADGLEITERSGKMWKLTAMPLRNELFNRLIAIGDQKWESW